MNISIYKTPKSQATDHWTTVWQMFVESESLMLQPVEIHRGATSPPS